MKKAYKFEIYPTETQKEIINKTIGCHRFVYNWALGLMKNDKLKIGEVSKKLTELKKQPDHIWLNEPSAQAINSALQHLKEAFQRFFRNCKSKKPGKKGFPKFKKKGKSRESFSNQQNLKGTQNKLELGPKQGWGFLTVPKLPKIKIRLHRDIEGKIGTITISKSPSGRYFASLCVTTPKDLPKKKKITTKNIVGIDRGLKNYLVLSNQQVVENPHHLIKISDDIAALSRKLQKKRNRNLDYKNSKRYNKLRIRLAKKHEAIAFQRSDFLHKTTNSLIKNKTINAFAIENLNIKGMMANHKLAKTIGDASWYEFQRQLIYKSDWIGKNVLKVNRFFPSSKICSNCEYVNENLKLNDREWICPQCNTTHDRDLNAAINIKKEALKSVQSNSGSSGSILNKARQC